MSSGFLLDTLRRKHPMIGSYKCTYSINTYSEGEAAIVVLLEALSERHNLLEQVGVYSHRCYSGEHPAVTCRGQAKTSEADIKKKIFIFNEHSSYLINFNLFDASMRSEVSSIFG